MDDKDRTLKALEDMKESMAYAVRRKQQIHEAVPIVNGGASTEESGTPMRPCPLCQGEAVGQEHPAHKHVFATFMPDHSGSYTIECPRCNLGLIADTEAEAKATWNSRTARETSTVAQDK